MADGSVLEAWKRSTMGGQVLCAASCCLFFWGAMWCCVWEGGGGGRATASQEGPIPQGPLRQALAASSTECREVNHVPERRPPMRTSPWILHAGHVLQQCRHLRSRERGPDHDRGPTSTRGKHGARGAAVRVPDAGRQAASGEDADGGRWLRAQHQKVRSSQDQQWRERQWACGACRAGSGLRRVGAGAGGTGRAGRPAKV